MRIAVVNLKGGTGKTTTAFFLASALSVGGSRVLLVDADPQGSAMSWASSAESEGELPFSVVSVAVSDAHKKIFKLAPDYDHVVIDTPPGEVAITRAALLAAEEALVAVSASAMDVERLRATLEVLAEVEPLNDLSYRILLTRVRRISREAADAREAMSSFSLPVMETEIPLLSFYPRSFSRIVDDPGDYGNVVRELGLAEAGQEVSR